jgi:arylsulfatase A-like enzyme/tetratricopeptide (TPR) repeat protein
MNSHIIHTVTLLPLFFGLLSGAQDRFPPLGKNPPNVMIITLDTTRSDHIGCYGYTKARTPNLDRLAKEGIRFTNAYSPVPLTLPAHCSIFTGTYPLFHHVRNNGNYFLPPQAETLAEILKKEGYSTAAFIASFILDSRFGLDQGFDLYDDDLGDNAHIKTLNSERRASEVFKSFASWYFRNKDKRIFAWIHFFDPHMPYDPPEPFKSAQGIDPYDGEIANVDLNIGRVLALLRKDSRVYENTLIVVAGDHGEGFGEHGEYGHGIYCYGETLNIPLILWAPGRLPANTVSRTPASLIDIAPTVFRFLGMPVPPFMQGKPLIPVPRTTDENKRSLFIESLFPFENLGCAPVRGIIRHGLKYLQLPRPELYDLNSDPMERSNLVSKRAAAAGTLRLELQSHEKRIGGNDFTSIRRMSMEERAKLESLGYFTASQASVRNESGLVDPKDAIRSWTLYQNGKQCLDEGKLAVAEEKFWTAIRENTRSINAYSDLAEIYFQQGKIAAMEQILNQGITANPSNGTLHMRRLYYLFQLGRTAEVLKLLTPIQGIISYWQREQFYNLAGITCGRAGMYTRAIIYFKELLDIEPANATAAKNTAYALFMSRRYREALEYYRLAEKKIPNDTQVITETAATLTKLKNYTSAECYYEKALAWQPMEETIIKYAKMLAEADKRARAIALLNRYTGLPAFSQGFRKEADRLISRWQKR